MWYLLYNAVLLIASPVILVILLSKQRCRRGLSQRFGFSPPRLKPDGRPLIWVHAVSLGEVVAVTPLIIELHRRHPDHRFAVSTVTETGREAVEQRLAGIAEHCYAPLDFPWVVSRMIDRLQPALYIFVETELWPNLLRHLRRRGVWTVLVNGRLSSRSFRRQQWALVRSFYRTIIQGVSLFLMQSYRDVERIVALGADVRVVRRTGNIKFDQPVPVSVDARSVRAALRIQDHDQLIVAGSTHPGEEEVLVDACRAVMEIYPSVRLLLAPRHIERADQVVAMVREKGLTVQRRSMMSEGLSSSGPAPCVVILDSRGELASLYREGAVTFVGGTLIPVGGHNLLEPALWGRPVLFGPYTDHCAEIATLLLQAAGGRLVTQANLVQTLIDLFNHPEERARMGRAARSVVEQNQGALRATVDAVEAVLKSTTSKTTSALTDERFPLVAGR
ncbi:MAG TPA: 3-deoxy-D-manno-octulosonic acid transferase [Nitrospira sp.]